MTKAHRAVAASQLPAELNDAFASADAKTICRAIGMQHFRIREENGLATSNDPRWAIASKGSAHHGPHVSRRHRLGTAAAYRRLRLGAPRIWWI